MIRNFTLAAAAVGLMLLGGTQAQAQHHHGATRAGSVHVSPARTAVRPAAAHVHSGAYTRGGVYPSYHNYGHNYAYQHANYGHGYYGHGGYYTNYYRPWYHRGYYGGYLGGVYLSPLWGTWDYFNPAYYYDTTPSYYYAVPNDYYTLPPTTVYPLPATGINNYLSAAPAPAANFVAHIEVIVPTGEAQVWFDDHATTQRGTTRRFDTPALQAGSTYSYTVRAAWPENGEMKTAERVVNIKAGGSVVVDFTR